MKAYAAVQGYQVEVVVTNQITHQPNGAAPGKVSVLGPEQETLPVAYSAPDHFRLERAGGSMADILGGPGWSPGNGDQYLGRALSRAGLTVYATIEDDLWQTRVLHNQDVTVDGIPVPCSVIEAMYRAQKAKVYSTPNRPVFWLKKRTFWVDTARYVVLREVDLVNGAESIDGTEFERTITVRKLAWDLRPPDSLFAVRARPGTLRPDDTVTSGLNGITPPVPIVDACRNITDPSEQGACLRSAQANSCRDLPLTPEVRIAQLNGSVELQYTIDTDGEPVDIRVTRPLGLGLDEQAVECVSHWRFRPAEKDGKPLAVPALLEVGMGADAVSVWHLRRVEFLPAKDGGRPMFSKAGYPPSTLPDQIEQVTGFSLFHLRLTIGKNGVPRAIVVVPSVRPQARQGGSPDREQMAF